MVLPEDLQKVGFVYNQNIPWLNNSGWVKGNITVQVMALSLIPLRVFDGMSSVWHSPRSEWTVEEILGWVE